MTDAMTAPEKPALVARADFQYRWRVYAFFIIVVGYGLWSLHDGFIKWPADNQRWHEMEAKGLTAREIESMKLVPPHNEAGILINQALGVVLPSIGIPLFIWLMYRSRGAYRLADETLRVPGREPIPLDRIQSLDKSRWDKKGIAVVEYHAADGSARTFALRDMVYARKTTDQIVDHIEKSLQSDANATTESRRHGGALNGSA
jgi:hypothetical protein